MSPPPSGSQARRGLYLGVIIIALIAGSVTSPYVTRAVDSAVRDGQNTIAVIEIDGRMTIDTAETVSNQLYAARQNDSVEAVVLRVNSPGGTISAAESVYMAVNATARQNPSSPAWAASLRLVGILASYQQSGFILRPERQSAM